MIMIENLNSNSETTEDAESLERLKSHSPNLTLLVLRFVAGAILIIGNLIGFIYLYYFFQYWISPLVAERESAPYLLIPSAIAIGCGFVIYALFNALALIVENLVVIRQNLSSTSNKL